MKLVPHILLGAVAFSALAPAVARAQDGDPVRGKQLSTECFACHGVDGNSPSPINPKLAGQHELYLYLALKAYANGARSDSLMRGAVLNKSDQDLRDIAAYYAGQGATGGDGGGPAAAPARTLRFDHGERNAAFASLAARARQVVGQRAPLPSDVCESEVQADTDSGLAVDRNNDGYLEICSADQLARLGRAGPAALQANYQLARDIDAAGIEDFEPIGNCGPTGNCMRALGQYGFAGSFDGRGFTIHNLRIERPESSGVGLFGVLAESGVVVDTYLRNVSVVGRAGTGALVGSNFGVVRMAAAQGKVRGELAIGGIVGGSSGLVYNTRFFGEVEGGQAVGGLVGDMTGAVYYGAAVEGSVKGVRGVGGLVGLNTFGSVISSAATIKVEGENDVGGLVGVNTDAKVWNSFAVGDVTAVGSNAGGLVGFNSLSVVRNAFSRGRVAAADSAGGLVGRNNGKISRSFAAGDVESPGLAGGLVGAVVEGTQEATYVRPDATAPYGSERAALAELTGENTNWAPAELPITNLLQYFCDVDEDGFISPAERHPRNYVWDFGRGNTPLLNCAAIIEGY